VTPFATGMLAMDCNKASQPGTLLHFVADKVEKSARSAQIKGSFNLAIRNEFKTYFSIILTSHYTH